MNVSMDGFEIINDIRIEKTQCKRSMYLDFLVSIARVPDRLPHVTNVNA